MACDSYVCTSRQSYLVSFIGDHVAANLLNVAALCSIFLLFYVMLTKVISNSSNLRLFETLSSAPLMMGNCHLLMFYNSFSSLGRSIYFSIFLKLKKKKNFPLLCVTYQEDIDDCNDKLTASLLIQLSINVYIIYLCI